ncbi:hypothetical protein FV113G1_P20270 (plasmid) [Fusobacterium varium]|nr:hypothetical protein FV113G1_P20270 [Fusobacterium varium]
MKKVLIGLMLLSLLVGCGGTEYSYEQKMKLIREAYVMTSYETKDEKAKAKLEKIMEDLEIKATKGDKKAEAELQDWKESIMMSRPFYNPKLKRTWDPVKWEYGEEEPERSW